MCKLSHVSSTGNMVANCVCVVVHVCDAHILLMCVLLAVMLSIVVHL